MPLLPRPKASPPYLFQPSTAVADRSVVDLDTLKARLGVEDDADDDLLAALLRGAKEEADRYLNNKFLKRGEDFAALVPSVELPIPSSVEEGIVEIVRARFGLRVSGAPASNVKREKVGDLEREYFEGGSLLAQEEIRLRCWRPWRLTPLG